MNESTLTQLKIIVERAVRPVRAGTSHKRKVREELLAHVSGVFEEESAKFREERSALERTEQRFGDPVELTSQLQEAVPANDPLDRFWDWMWGQPDESTLRRAVRQVLLLQAIALMILLLTFSLVGGKVSEWPALLLSTGPLVVGYSLVWLLCTFLADGMRQALYGPTGRSRSRAAAVGVAWWVLLLSLIVGLPVLFDVGWLDMDYVTALVTGAALMMYVLGVLRSLAEISAVRLRSHREWAGLPI